MIEQSGFEGYKSEEETAAAADFEAGKREEQEETVEKEKQRPFDSVIVLGAGIDDPEWKKFLRRNPSGKSTSGVKLTEQSTGWQLPYDARMRTIAAAEMYIQGLTREIIFTGGSTGAPRGTQQSEASLMRDLAIHILERAGISSEEAHQAIVLEDKATNTIENIANVCNIIDQNPDNYQNLAILTNEYHLDRAKELISKFNLEAKGYKAEDLLASRSAKYKKILDSFFASEGYQKRLIGEKRWTKGLRDIPRYWYPQALAVENPERIDYILRSLGYEQIAAKVGREKVAEHLRGLSRKEAAEFLSKLSEDKL